MKKITVTPILAAFFFFLAIVIIAGLIIYSKVQGSKIEVNFYDQSFTTTVITSNSYHNRSIEFHLRNGLKLYFMPSDKKKVEVGDSIQKKGKTYLYDVYRKNSDGDYKFWATYNFEESL